MHAIAGSLPRNQNSPKSMFEVKLRSQQLNLVRADKGYKLSTDDSHTYTVIDPDKLIAIIDWAILDYRFDRHPFDHVLD